jgi:hypothetical protein
MIKSLLINSIPLPVEEIFSTSVDRLGRFIMSNTDNVIVPIELPHESYMEKIVDYLDFSSFKNSIGNTDTLFFNKDNVIKIIYIHLSKDTEQNILASILQPESKTIRGKAIILKYNENQDLVDFTKEDLIKLLVKRREHEGLHIKNKEILTVTIDNRWNLLSGIDLSKKYKQIVRVCNYYLLIISDNKDGYFDDDQEKYIFSFLDRYKKTIIDFSEIEFKLLLEKKNVHSENIDDDKAFSPYHFLKSV